jgi:hypothetical protein
MFPADVAIVSTVSRRFARTAGYIRLAPRPGVDHNEIRQFSGEVAVSDEEKRKSIDQTGDQSGEELTQREALGRFARYTAPILLATLLSQGHGMAGTTVSPP